jgi:hypothetical protein
MNYSGFQVSFHDIKRMCNEAFVANFKPPSPDSPESTEKDHETPVWIVVARLRSKPDTSRT